MKVDDADDDDRGDREGSAVEMDTTIVFSMPNYRYIPGFAPLNGQEGRFKDDFDDENRRD